VSEEQLRVTVHVRGHVQGVGFRWWTRARALELGLTGRATNLADGRVEVVAEGPPDATRRLTALLGDPDVPGRPGTVAGITVREGVARGETSGFVEA
jgi:acylphosphatase